MENLRENAGLVIQIEILERQVVFFTTKGLSIAEINRRTGLNEKSITKLLENVSRKIEAARSVGREKV